MTKVTPDILDQLQHTPQPVQPQQLKNKLGLEISQRIIAKNAKTTHGLSYFLKKIRYALPVGVLLLTLIRGAYTTVGTKNEKESLSSPKYTQELIDNEMKELIQLAFSFETIRQNQKVQSIKEQDTIKTSSIESDMILAYLRE